MSVMWGSGAGGPSAREDATLPNGALGEVYSSGGVGGRADVDDGSGIALLSALHDVGLGAAAEGLLVVWWDSAAFAPRAGPVAPAFVGGAPVVITAGAASAVLLLAPRVESGGAYWVLLGEVGKAVPMSHQRLARWWAA